MKKTSNNFRKDVEKIIGSLFLKRYNTYSKTPLSGSFASRNYFRFFVVFLAAFLATFFFATFFTAFLAAFFFAAI